MSGEFLKGSPSLEIIDVKAFARVLYEGSAGCSQSRALEAYRKLHEELESLRAASRAPKEPPWILSRADTLYRWRVVIEAAVDELPAKEIVDARGDARDELTNAKARLEALANEVFEAYLQELGSETR